MTQGQEKFPICGKANHKLENCFYNPFNPNNKLKSTDLVDSVKEDEKSESDKSAIMV